MATISPAAEEITCAADICWLFRPTEALEQNVELNDLGFVYYDVGR
jgi:hypothetical protein